MIENRPDEKTNGGDERINSGNSVMKWIFGISEARIGTEGH